jgi:hypothetical protein
VKRCSSSLILTVWSLIKVAGCALILKLQLVWIFKWKAGKKEPGKEYYYGETKVKREGQNDLSQK